MIHKFVKIHKEKVKDSPVLWRIKVYFFGIKFSFKVKKYLKVLKESASAHKLLDGLRGIEIGGASYNPWGLETINIDYRDDKTSKYSDVSILYYNVEPLKVDIIARGNDLPFKDNTWDFVINSHVLEHFRDPISALEEWMRVIKPGGYLYMNIPHKERTFDKDRPRTTLAELIERHKNTDNLIDTTEEDIHHNVWITEDVVELCNYLNYNIIEYMDADDKDGIGFTIIIKKAL